MSPMVELLIADPPLFGEIYDGVEGLQIVVEDSHYFSEDDGTHYVQFWWVWGGDFGAFEKRARAYRYTGELQQLTALEDRRLYRVTTTPLPEERMLLPFFRRQDITVLDGRASNDGLWHRVRVGDRETLRTLVDRLQSLEASPRIERIYLPRDGDGGADALTEKQRESIRLAFDRGYFESPSQVTLEELAADLEITPQMLSKHIRSGVRKLVAESVGETGPPSAPDWAAEE